MQIVKLAECGSTNDEAWERLSDEPVLVVTDRQTKGRGRQGREWVSSPIGNLYASLVIPVKSAEIQRHLSWLPLAAGIAAARTLEGLCGPITDLRLKWPNDIYLNDAKLGGILCESRFQGDSVYGVVVGFGLNIAHTPKVDDRKVVSLAEFATEFQGEYALQFRDQFSEAWAQSFLEIFYSLEAGPIAVAKAWHTYAKLERFSETRTHIPSGELVTVHALGLDDAGQLRAKLPSGDVITINQAE